MSEARDLGRMTYAEYLALEERSETKHEFRDGRVYDMAGGTPEHARLQARMIVALSRALADKPCAPFSSDLRIYVGSARRTAYPDVTVVGDAVAHDPEDAQAATNPTLIVEVLSPTTEAEDRGAKWQLYQRIPSLRHYVLVAQDRANVEVFTRTDLGWHYASHAEGAIRFSALDAVVSVDEIYAGALAS